MPASPKTKDLNVSELIEQFCRINSQCATIVITLGTPQNAKQFLRRLRQQGTALGRQMQRLGRANLKQPPSRNPADPNVPNNLTEEDFLREFRRCIWECLEQLSDTNTMDPNQRLTLLRRHLWVRGRRLELICKACVVDRDELLRIIQEGERGLSRASTKRT
jgi:hypothetical protein